MTKEETARRISIMQGFLDGKQVQAREDNGRWANCSDPCWDFGYWNYRIKPEPKIIYVNEYEYPASSNPSTTIAAGGAYDSREAADKNASPLRIGGAKKYIEVIEE